MEKRRRNQNDSLLNTTVKHKAKSIKPDRQTNDELELENVSSGDEEISAELEESLLNEESAQVVASTPNNSGNGSYSKDTTAIYPNSSFEIQLLNRSLENLNVTNTDSATTHSFDEPFERKIELILDTFSPTADHYSSGNLSSDRKHVENKFLLVLAARYRELGYKVVHKKSKPQKNSPESSNSSSSLNILQKETAMPKASTSKAGGENMNNDVNMDVDGSELQATVAKLLVIAATNYPDQLISIKDRNAIMEYLREAVVARLDLEDKPNFPSSEIVDFGNVLMHGGEVHIAFFNNYTAMWLAKTIKSGVAGKAIQLSYEVKCAPRDKIDCMPTFSVYCCDQSVSFDYIKKKMKNRRMAPTDDWVFLNSKGWHLSRLRLSCVRTLDESEEKQEQPLLRGRSPQSASSAAVR